VKAAHGRDLELYYVVISRAQISYNTVIILLLVSLLRCLQLLCSFCGVRIAVSGGGGCWPG
jgi:hypothetical protein